MVDSDPKSAFSLSNLLCEEETEVCLDEEETKDEDEMVEFDPKEDEEYVKLMFEKEISNLHPCSSQFTTTSSSRPWIISARSDAIQWILNTRALFGFRFKTASLSVIYLDRFLSKRVVDSDKQPWAIRLLGVACLSLAAKMEECKVPALSVFPMEEYNFESNVIQRMELLVSSTLEWRMDSVTPFAYINFFVSKFSNSPPRRNTISSVSELILATTGEMKFMGYRPSVIAAVAALVALDQKLPMEALELKINACSLNQILQTEDLFSCYNRMQELDMEKDKLPKHIQSPDLSPMQVDGFGKSSVTSCFRAKRKRLAFDDFDQNNAMPSEKRHY